MGSNFFIEMVSITVKIFVNGNFTFNLPNALHIRRILLLIFFVSNQKFNFFFKLMTLIYLNAGFFIHSIFNVSNRYLILFKFNEERFSFLFDKLEVFPKICSYFGEAWD